MDKWLDGHTRLHDIALNIPTDMLAWRVSDGVDLNGCWNLEVLQAILPLQAINMIKAHPPPSTLIGPDLKYWPGDSSGIFSVSLAYQTLSYNNIIDFSHLWGVVWKLNVTERVRCFVWQILHGKLPTKYHCRKWVMVSSIVIIAKEFLKPLIMCYVIVL